MGSRRRAATVGERGQAMPLMILIVWVIAASILLVVHLGARAVDEARAQSAADAVAMAAALRWDVAAAVAAANEGRVLTMIQRGEEVFAEVAQGRGVAVAAAVAEGAREAPCHRYPTSDPLHFWLCRTTPTR